MYCYSTGFFSHNVVALFDTSVLKEVRIFRILHSLPSANTKVTKKLSYVILVKFS